MQFPLVQTWINGVIGNAKQSNASEKSTFIFHVLHLMLVYNLDGNLLAGKSMDRRFHFAEGPESHRLAKPVIELGAYCGAALPPQNPIAAAAVLPCHTCCCLVDAPQHSSSHAFGSPFLLHY